MRNAHVRSCDCKHHLYGLSQQIRDAIALCEYFAWLEREVPKGCVTEVSGAHQLELYRRLWYCDNHVILLWRSCDLIRELDDYVSLSFATISSSGPNGAVIHYWWVGLLYDAFYWLIFKQSNYRNWSFFEHWRVVFVWLWRAVQVCSNVDMAMCSPSPCRDGTTDVTRVLHFGLPTAYQRECFTRVLKGHIALCTAIFPSNTLG